MSTEILEINYNKETNFDFELSITGISANDAKVRFGLEFPGYTMQIPCSRGDDKMWSVTVPNLEELGVEEGNYSFTIELIANGYHFAPVKGTASLKPIAEVVGSVPRKSIEVNVSGITKKDKPKEEPTKEEKKEEKVVMKAEKEEEKREKKEEVKEEVEEKVDIVEQMVSKRFKPFEKGRSILDQLRERTEGPELTEADKKVKDILKDI